MSVKEEIELVHAQKALKKKDYQKAKSDKLLKHRPRILVVIIYNVLIIAFFVLVIMALSGIVVK